MQPTVAEAIERATLEIFAMMVGIDIVTESDLQARRGPPEANVVSSFTLSGAICGTAKVYYAMPLAKRITCHMLQVDGSAANEEDILDAAGEVANMIVGNVKNSLESQWGAIRIGTPKVELSGAQVERDQSMSVTFRCSDNVFTVSVAFQADAACTGN